jgi:hypothetical protein
VLLQRFRQLVIPNRKAVLSIDVTFKGKQSLGVLVARFTVWYGSGPGYTHELSFSVLGSLPQAGAAPPPFQLLHATNNGLAPTAVLHPSEPGVFVAFIDPKTGGAEVATGDVQIIVSGNTIASSPLARDNVHNRPAEDVTLSVPAKYAGNAYAYFTINDRQGRHTGFVDFTVRAATDSIFASTETGDSHAVAARRF